MGRCFCTEECIRDYFQPTVDFMDEELRKLRSDGDFSASETARLAHYRSLTLEDPDEIWLEQTETSERHFTFITHFRHGDERFSYVVICLAIDGVPSFVFLSFPTRDDDLVDEFRRGVDLRVNEDADAAAPAGTGSESERGDPNWQDSEADAALDAVAAPRIDDEAGSYEYPESGLEASGSEVERLHSELRRPGDIPRAAFDKFESFIDPTLDDPDEIWRFIDDEGNEWCTFIARHSLDELEGDVMDEFTMVAVCEPRILEYEDGEVAGYGRMPGRGRSLDVIFAFPTVDPGLVQHFRKGINSLNKAFGVGWARGRAA